MRGNMSGARNEHPAERAVRQENPAACHTTGI